MSTHRPPASRNRAGLALTWAVCVPSGFGRTFLVGVDSSSRTVERAGSNPAGVAGRDDSRCEGWSGGFQKSRAGTSATRRAFAADGGGSSGGRLDRG
jgi:hypothetical protein